MKRILPIALLSFLLTGCVVTPYGPYPSNVRVEAVYYWDPVAVQYYFIHSGRRNYMPRGWRHEHDHDHGGRGRGRRHD
jgi:hypothetical protein